MEHFRGLPLLVLQLSGVVADFMIMRLFWMWTKISEIWIRDQMEIEKGILGRTGVILYFGLDLEHFRRMRTIRSRRLRLVMNCFRMRFWAIRLFRFMRNCLSIRKVRALGVYSGRYWSNWSSVGCCGMPYSAGLRCSQWTCSGSGFAGTGSKFS